MSTLELGPLAQIARTVRDIKESEAWYGQTLGLKHLYSFGSLAFFDCGGTRLYLSAADNRHPNRSCTCASRTSAPPTTRCAPGAWSSARRRTWSTATPTAPRSGWRTSTIRRAGRWRCCAR